MACEGASDRYEGLSSCGSLAAAWFLDAVRSFHLLHFAGNAIRGRLSATEWRAGVRAVADGCTALMVELGVAASAVVRPPAPPRWQRGLLGAKLALEHTQHWLPQVFG
jgi:hypothetical protein